MPFEGQHGRKVILLLRTLIFFWPPYAWSSIFLYVSVFCTKQLIFLYLVKNTSSFVAISLSNYKATSVFQNKSNSLTFSFLGTPLSSSNSLVYDNIVITNYIVFSGDIGFNEQVEVTTENDLSAVVHTCYEKKDLYFFNSLFVIYTLVQQNDWKNSTSVMAVAFRERWNNFTCLKDGVTLNTHTHWIRIKTALVTNTPSKEQILEKHHITTHRKQLWFQLHNAVWPLL